MREAAVELIDRAVQTAISVRSAATSERRSTTSVGVTGLASAEGTASAPRSSIAASSVSASASAVARMAQPSPHPVMVTLTLALKLPLVYAMTGRTQV